MSKLTPSQKEAHRRVQKSLEQIEAAQRLLGDACGTLSRITWAAPKWSKVGKMYDRVHALWYDVQSLRSSSKIDLDPDAKQAFEDRLAASGVRT